MAVNYLKMGRNAKMAKGNSASITSKKFSPRRPVAHKTKPMSILSAGIRISGTEYCGDHKFSCGHVAPIYEILNVHALNQIIGYAKFKNCSFGDVYYRGEGKLHDSIHPSIFRNCSIPSPVSKKLKDLINKIATDPKMKKQLKIDPLDSFSTEYTIEGMLQHYGIPTRFIDVVDNHWVALWMGLNKNQDLKQISTYNHYAIREIPLVDFVGGKSCKDEDLFQYILLVAVPGHSDRINNGIYISDDFIEIDLRQALPSTFLRPHAQHGLVIRKRPHNGDKIEDYDMAHTVVGILKLRIDRVQDWIGTGQLLTQDNLFPPPAYDHGYDILLSRGDLFENSQYCITQYI